MGFNTPNWMNELSDITPYLATDIGINPNISNKIGKVKCPDYSPAICPSDCSGCKHSNDLVKKLNELFDKLSTSVDDVENLTSLFKNKRGDYTGVPNGKILSSLNKAAGLVGEILVAFSFFQELYGENSNYYEIRDSKDALLVKFSKLCSEISAAGYRTLIDIAVSSMKSSIITILGPFGFVAGKVFDEDIDKLEAYLKEPFDGKKIYAVFNNLGEEIGSGMYDFVQDVKKGVKDGYDFFNKLGTDIGIAAADLYFEKLKRDHENKKNEFNQWYENEKNDMSWHEGLPNCPLELDLINGKPKNPDTFVWSDPGPAPGNYHGTNNIETSAKWEIRSAKPNKKGAGQQCCYNYKGKLITSGRGAGTADKKVPTLNSLISHYYSDVTPFNDAEYLDKFYGGNEFVNKYLQVRPQNQGENN
jgi:hypothetical protein